MGSRAASLKGLSVGQLKDLVTFQKKTLSKDDIGGDVVSWSTQTTGWAKIMPYRGNRGTFGQQSRTVLTHYMFTPWIDSPVIDSSMIVSYNNRLFQIVYIEDVEELHEWFYLELQEGVPT